MIRGDDNHAVSTRASGKHKIERRLAAILGADIAGYSTLMADAEEETHRRVGAEIDRMHREIEKSHGRVFTFAGDGVMAEFPSAIEALKCALRIQADGGRRNAKLPPDRWIRLRIGVNSGEIMLQENRTGGTAVNIAKRLEAFAEPGGVCLSAAVFEQVRRSVSASYEPVGEQHFKNIRDPVTVYGIRASSCSSWNSMPAMPRQYMPGTTMSQAGGAGSPRIAVLPFRIIGPKPLPTYFADGLVEDIVCMLAGLREPEVISSNTTRALRDRDIDLAGVGHALGVRYVVSGLLHPVGEWLRLSVELAEAETGTVLWKQNHDTDEARLFDVHDSIVANVVNLLAPRVTQAELRRIRRIRPENLGAYHLMLQARELIFDLDSNSFDRARELLREAITLEPEYAASYVALSHWCSLRLGQGWSADRAADANTLDHAIHTALRHDPSNAHAMAMLGHNRTLLAQNYPEALALFDCALQAAPNDATVWTLSSPTFAFMGEPVEAIRRSERALSLSPQDPFAFRIHHFLSIGHFFNGSYSEAEHWGRESLQGNSNYTSNLRMLACILVEQGNLTEARRLAARAVKIQPDFHVRAAVTRFPSRDERLRQIYGNNLLAAGIPD